MAVIPKEPLEWLGLFRQQMDEIFRYLSTLEGQGLPEKEHSPLVDIYETPASFVVEVELPGCEKKDIALSICCSTLVVEALTRDEAGPKVNYTCLERVAGRFCRAVEIPPMVDLGGVRARLQRGLLTVEFPWSKNKRTHIREITIE